MTTWLGFWLFVCMISVLSTGISLMGLVLLKDDEKKPRLATVTITFWYLSLVSTCAIFIGIYLK